MDINDTIKYDNYNYIVTNIRLDGNILDIELKTEDNHFVWVYEVALNRLLSQPCFSQKEKTEGIKNVKELFLLYKTDPNSAIQKLICTTNNYMLSFFLSGLCKEFNSEVSNKLSDEMYDFLSCVQEESISDSLIHY